MRLKGESSVFRGLGHGSGGKLLWMRGGFGELGLDG